MQILKDIAVFEASLQLWGSHVRHPVGPKRSWQQL